SIGLASAAGGVILEGTDLTWRGPGAVALAIAPDAGVHTLIGTTVRGVIVDPGGAVAAATPTEEEP
ncbi:MAG: hypothetical protein ACOY3Y_08840, partial [Acidobacteriota bacterium]